MSLVSEKRLRNCETLSNPYCFDDYAQTMAEKSGIKEEEKVSGVIRWVQAEGASPMSSPFSLPHALIPYGHFNAPEESNFIKVINFTLFIFFNV